METPTTDRKRARWISCAVVVLLSHAACSAQTAATSPSALGNDPASETAVEATIGRSLQPGEYITEKGWGHLQLSERGSVLAFSIESVAAEDYCTLDGTIQGNRGIAKSDNGPSVCTVKFTSTLQGIDVAVTTPTECKTFCGYNGSFEGPYLKVKDGCGRNDIDRTRKEFKRLYDGKNYNAALTTLSPVLANCQPTLEWEEEGAVRNDLAIAQYKNGLHSACLETLGQYSEDAMKDDEAVMEGWTPALADRYLSIVKAARTNIALCDKK
jgi:hypothetical protein